MMSGSSRCVGLFKETDSRKESKSFPEVKVLNIGELSAKTVNMRHGVAARSVFVEHTYLETTLHCDVTSAASIFSVVHSGRRPSSHRRREVGSSDSSSDRTTWLMSIK